MTSSQIDRLGERLKLPELAEADLRALDDYRRSFAIAYEIVLNAVRQQVGLQPTGRVAKSTTSIVDKLRRESIRLSQMQDIAGCRVVLPDILAQNDAIEHLQHALKHLTVVDRRSRPSHGYRAVHLVVKSEGKLVEIQIRTVPQHLWAEISEKLADKFDPALKYGNGPELLQTQLDELSRVVENQESLDASFAEARKLLATEKRLPEELRKSATEVAERLDRQSALLRSSMQQFLASLPE